MKIRVPNAKPPSRRAQKAGSQKRHHNPPPSHTALVPDPEQEGKLTRIGVLKHIDDNPRARQLAYENLERIVLLPID